MPLKGSSRPITLEGVQNIVRMPHGASQVIHRSSGFPSKPLISGLTPCLHTIEPYIGKKASQGQKSNPLKRLYRCFTLLLHQRKR